MGTKKDLTLLPEKESGPRNLTKQVTKCHSREKTPKKPPSATLTIKENSYAIYVKGQYSKLSSPTGKEKPGNDPRQRRPRIKELKFQKKAHVYRSALMQKGRRGEAKPKNHSGGEVKKREKGTKQRKFVGRFRRQGA